MENSERAGIGASSGRIFRGAGGGARAFVNVQTGDNLKSRRYVSIGIAMSDDTLHAKVIEEAR